MTAQEIKIKCEAIIEAHKNKNLFWDFVAPDRAVGTLSDYNLDGIDENDTKEWEEHLEILTLLANAKTFDIVTSPCGHYGWVVIPANWTQVRLCEMCDTYTNETMCKHCEIETELKGEKHEIFR